VEGRVIRRHRAESIDPMAGINRTLTQSIPSLVALLVENRKKYTRTRYKIQTPIAV
jgi:hypothetical protein